MSISYANFKKTNEGGQQQDLLLFQRRFKHVDVLWYPYGGIPDRLRPERLHVIHQLCDVSDIPNLSHALQNERNSVSSGKDEVSVNDGNLIEGTINFKADNIYGLKAMISQNMQNQSLTTLDLNPVVEDGGVYDDMGVLILVSSNENHELMGSQALTGVEVSILESPGSQNSDSITRAVRIRSRKRMFHSGRGTCIVPFMFYDDGTNITNAAAPDGVLTAFDLKDQNFGLLGTTPQAAPLLAQTMDPTVSTGARYIPELRINGSITTDYTFNQTTGVITFTNPPADGAKIEGLVCLATGAPDFLATRAYATGEVVKNASGVNQIANADNGPGAYVAGNWTDLTDQAFQLPYWINDSTSYMAGSTTWQFCLHSWTEVMHS